MTGSELDQLSDDELRSALQRNVTFARTTPEHKLRIVSALQAEGHVVAMTGDGVNDAPALKKADIGVAMGIRGTDVAKGAADMVLTDDNFSSIIGAIEEGRRQYDNIQKFVRYLLSSNTGEVIAIFASILARGPLILLPVQILWMNLVTDGLSAVALGVERAEESVMRRPPRDTRARVLDRTGVLMILLLGGYVGLATLGIYSWYLAGDERMVAVAQTVAFSAIIVIQKVNVLNFRSLRAPLNRQTFWTNPWLLLAILVTLLIHVAAVYVPFLQNALHTIPLRGKDWCVIAVCGLPVFLVTELAKRIASSPCDVRFGPSCRGVKAGCVNRLEPISKPWNAATSTVLTRGKWNRILREPGFELGSRRGHLDLAVRAYFRSSMCGVGRVRYGSAAESSSQCTSEGVRHAFCFFFLRVMDRGYEFVERKSFVHPSPTYARLQIVSRIRAELLQRLRSLSALSTSGQLPSELGVRFALAICRLERVAQEVVDESLFRRGAVAQDVRTMERQLRGELDWLTGAVERLYCASINGELSIALCDEVLSCIASHQSKREPLAV